MNGVRIVAAAVMALLVTASVGAAQPVDTGRVSTAPGVSIYYERYGSGPQVVFVPNRLFMPELRELQRANRTLILYDMRNRGRSGRVADSTQLTIVGDVQDVEQLRQHFRAERLSLVGYSYLGLMVALYATDHPQRVERLVQIGPVPREFGTAYPNDATADLSTLNGDGLAAASSWRSTRDAATPASDQTVLCHAQHRFLAYLLVGNPGNHARVPNVCIYENERYDNQQRHLAAHFGDIQKRRFPKEPFTKLEIPVLTVHGTFDRNAPYGAGLEWATTFRDGRLITIEGGAHQVWLDDAQVLRDIDAFLAGSWPLRAQKFGRQ